MPRPGLSIEQINFVVAGYHTGRSPKEMAAELGFSHGTLYRALRRAGVTVRTPAEAVRENAKISHRLSRSFSDEQEAKIAAAYIGGESSGQIASRLAIHRALVFHVLRRRRVCRRKCSRRLPLNEYVFDRAESSEVASYFVGLLMADGTIQTRGGKPTGFKLSLAAEDGEHIAEFRTFLGSGHKILVENNSRKPNSWGKQPLHSLSISSSHMAAALSRYGVVPRKSQRCRVAILSQCRHFWRGMVCGDGSVQITRHGYPKISLSGTKDCVEQFAAFCHTISPVEAKPSPNGPIWQVSFGGGHAYRIIKDIFFGASVSLQRKASTAEKVISDCSKYKDIYKRRFKIS